MTAGTSAGRFQLGPSSLTEALYESLRARIVNGDIAPGERLTEQRIAGEYDVARPTAKACLEKLTALGLLRRTAHKTAVVPELDIDDITDLFFCRGLVESAAAGRLAATTTVPDAATEAQQAMIAAVEQDAYRDQVEADIAFHTALVGGVGSTRLSRLFETISGEIQLSMGLYQAHKTAKPASVAHEHDAILTAIADGNQELAERCVREHLQHAADRVAARREQQLAEPENQPTV
ncbi:GntR family transcriptional regulator [Microlunatus soli]|uniref:DNA-binding transcriptional regulator, GntR family n=1 Tax=Microlunatus soli TaxID=630515 RepID=A0A1H1XTE3_9ACTN|nr:GntR family transcriptional regulator [Microlunatus soli]SDT12524.1 DNA-binding transcriptional regulator, GntR family [Microlunatus soli]